MNLNPRSSILEKVRAHIPNIDRHAPTCENADVIGLFQRPAGLSLRVPDDPDSFSVEDADLERLDQLDLDNVQNLKEDELSLQKHVTVEPVKTHANGDSDRLHTDIMERLVAFCKSQSSESVREPVKCPDHIRQNNMWKQSHRECPTIFIDLRCPDPSIKPSGVSSKLSSESMSPAKHSIHQEVPSAKKPSIEVHSESRMDGREVTGKSMLLQKIRTINRNGNKYPNTYTDPLGPGKEKPSHSVDSTCNHNSQHLWEGKQSSAVQPDFRPEMGSPATVQQNPVKEPKQQSGQQRQLKQTLQNDEYQQILKQLEIHRPTKSVCQKQPAAERTDVLYDFESSHLESFNMLPEDTINKGCMLLIVYLSSPGMVGDRAHGKRKHLYSAETKTHIYNTLVTWFLSLVGPHLHHNEDKGDAKVPFYVAGLQQVWTEDGLALHVLALARQCYTPRKGDFDIHAPFYNHVCTFLSETTVTQIAHWLPKLKLLLDQQAFASPILLPSSSLNSFISTTADKKAICRTFDLGPGFYWQTVETQECVCKRRETTQELHTDVSFALGSNYFFLHPLITHYTLQLVFNLGLDVCGLRLLYPPQRFLTGSAGVYQTADDTCQPVFALAVRGPRAFLVLKDLTESLYPLLPKKPDPTYVSLLQSQSQGPSLFYSPQLASQVHKELCMWFSGRLQGGTAQNHNQHLNRAVPLSDGVRGSLFSLSRSSAFLCATTKADVLLVVSPAVPPCCYSQVLAVCERRGFGLMGLKRLKLQSKSATLLRLTNQQARVFCSSPIVTLDQEELELHSQCLVLLLRKENAMHHSVSLPAALMTEFKAQKLLNCIDSRNNSVQAVEPILCFHTVPYSSSLFHTFVKSMWTVPDPSSVILSHQKCQSSCDMEQVVILTLSGNDMSHGLSLLHRMLTERPEGDVEHAEFKLLGLKWLPVLTQLQSQELSPYEVGEQLFHSSLDNLMSSPVLLCALRRRGAFASLEKFLPYDYPGNLSVLVSSTPEVAFRQALLFFEHEIIKFFHS